MILLFEAKIPVKKHAVKKNGRNIFFNKKTGRMFPGKSDKLRYAESELIIGLKQSAIFNKLYEPITEPVIMQCLFYFPNYYAKPKKKAELLQRNKNIPDLSNLYQVVEDSLQNAGIIENDRLIDGHDGSRRLYGKENCVVIRLYKAKDGANGAGPGQ